MSLETEPPVDGDACSKLHFCSEKHDLNPHFTLSEEQEESRSCVRQAETFFLFLFVNRLFSMRYFDATGVGGVVHVTELTSPTPVSVVTCPSCVWVSLIQLTVFHINSVKRNPVCVKDKNPFVSTIYCLHNTGFQFVTNCLFRTVYSLTSYIQSFPILCHGYVLHWSGLG